MNNHDDLIVEGFAKLDDKFIEKRPPKIAWGEKYKQWSDAEKIEYLEKLAASMNHAAFLVQGERNELGKLCELKEKQLISMNAAVRQNNAMLQHEVTLMNEQRQGYNAEVSRLNRLIRELKANGDKR